MMYVAGGQWSPREREIYTPSYISSSFLPGKKSGPYVFRVVETKVAVIKSCFEAKEEINGVKRKRAA